MARNKCIIIIIIIIMRIILNGHEHIDSNICFEIKESKITRGQNFTLVKKQSRLDVRKFSFSQRTIKVGNKLYWYGQLVGHQPLVV